MCGYMNGVERRDLKRELYVERERREEVAKRVAVDITYLSLLPERSSVRDEIFLLFANVF